MTNTKKGIVGGIIGLFILVVAIFFGGKDDGGTVDPTPTPTPEVTVTPTPEETVAPTPEPTVEVTPVVTPVNETEFNPPITVPETNYNPTPETNFSPATRFGDTKYDPERDVIVDTFRS